MYYHYRVSDPVLQKLSNSTISALHDQNIICVEDFFGLKEKQILDLHGIGKKRADEIMDFLYSLPFDYMDSSLPPNPEQNPMLDIHPVLTDHIRNLYHYANNQVLKRGLFYFSQNRVNTLILADGTSETYKAEVRGSRLYTVEFSLNKSQNGEIRCNCPAFNNWWYGSIYCKHLIATFFALAEQQRTARFMPTGEGKKSYRQMVRSLKSARKEAILQSSKKLSYLLENRSGQWNLYPKSIYGLIKSQQKSRQYSYSYSYKNPWDQLIPKSSKDRLIISYLRKIYDQDPHLHRNQRNGKEVIFGDVFELLENETLKLKHDVDGSASVHVTSESYTFLLQIGRHHESNNGLNNAKNSDLDLRFLLKKGDKAVPINAVEFVSSDPCWVYHSGNLSKVESSELARRFFLNTAREQIQIPADEIESFLQEMFPILQQADLPVEIDEDLTTEKKVEPEPRIYLSENARQLLVELRIAYGSYELTGQSDGDQLLIPADVGERENRNPALLWSVKRNKESEQKWIDCLIQSALEPTDSPFVFTPERDSLEWVIEHLPKLSESGIKIFGVGELKKFARPKKMTSSSFRVSSGEQWFELEGEMTFGDVSLNINDIKRVLVKDKPYVQLQDNTTGELPANWLNQLKKLLQLVEPDKKKTRIPKIAANVVEELVKTADSYEQDADFEDYVKRLRSFEHVEDIDPPKNLNGELRSYQQAGLSWMYFLNRFGFGGILADDMGLGKTVQVLALLQKMAETGKKKPNCLIIAPRSVIHNWQAEANKFAPDFEVYIHHGVDRVTDPDNWPQTDLCITTYSTMRNDIGSLKEKTFDYAILDESHTVRNPASKTFRALKMIKANNRLCMSGTPVQNTSMDLWSQFQFLNPGLLGSQKRFREQWVKPVEEKNDKTAEEMLHKMVSPFILRRTKQQVATDLPPLTSTLVECPMDTSQQIVYERYRQVYHQLINDSLEEKGVRESRFTVLEGLTRLRQICCSPGLIDGEKGNSAKLKRFTELAGELISEGHRMLVFSQFVGFLKLIEAEVKQRGWKYEYLDGQTRDRQERVDRFQSDSSKDLFLISLKAGGEGLNLTAADYVFIMDPWWNPAAERQAMDRTHRIGQKENVFVYRLVSPGTVEEKILRLQERKQGLAKKLVVAESGIFKELNRDDLLSLFE